MALADLLTALQAEAAEEAAHLESQALAEASRIVDDARAEAHAIETRHALAGAEDLRREAARRRALARLAGSAGVRRAREESFRRLLEELQARLATERESHAYPAVLRALIEESLAALPGATELRVDPRDLQLAADVAGELGVALQLAATIETSGGVELVAGDGRIVRNTLEERLANAESPLRLLFGKLLAERAAPREALGEPLR